MPPILSPFVSLALSRLRRGVTVCCWTVGMCLCVQVLIWCFAAYTQVRFETVESKAKPTAIVTPHQSAPAMTGVQAAPPVVAPGEAASLTVDPNRVPGRLDAIFAKASSIAKAVGTISMVLLLPLLTIGVLLGAGSATSGVEQTISAFMWALVIGVLVLPLGHIVGLPWDEGALGNYAIMTNQVEKMAQIEANAVSRITFYAQFAFLPLACVAGLAMVGLRFSAGVNAGIIQKENFKLDPVLEKEAANVKPGSLHGGRAGNAMRSAGITPQPERKPAIIGSVTQLATVEAPPRRII